VTLSPTDFVRCFTLPGGAHSSQELLTMARTAGDGGARLFVYSQFGGQMCVRGPAVETVAADVVPCDFAATTWYTVLIVGQGLDATFRLARRDIAVDALTCPDVTSTVVGGPSTAGRISAPANVRCYTATADPGDRYFMTLRSPSPSAHMMWVGDNDGYSCSGVRACISYGFETARRYRFLVWAATAGVEVPFRLDTWKILTAGHLAPGCEAIPSIAYGPGPLTGTMSDEQSGRCLSTQVGTSDTVRVAVTNPDGTANVNPATYVFDAFPPPDSAFAFLSCTVSCRPMSDRPAGQSMPAVIILSPGGEFGSLPYRAQISCLSPPCGAEPAVVATVAPAITGPVRVGATVRATPGAWNLAATTFAYQWSADGVPINGATGSAYAIPVALRGRRLRVTVTARLPGHPDGAATSAAAVIAPGAAPRVVRRPNITGAVRARRTVKVAPGTWSLKPDAYAYQWRLNGKPIRGATRPTLKLTSAMARQKLTVIVTARKTGYQDSPAASPAVVVRR
jgi:hypothetical protein